MKEGENYFIRTVTMYYTGKLVRFTDKELVLVNCAWIADTGRFTQAMQTGRFDEVEMYPEDVEVIINREAMLDMHKIKFELPKEQK